MQNLKLPSKVLNQLNNLLLAKHQIVENFHGDSFSLSLSCLYVRVALEKLEVSLFSFKSFNSAHAFRHFAPVVWNSLPQYLITDLSKFRTLKRQLKTELYRRAFLQ